MFGTTKAAVVVAVEDEDDGEGEDVLTSSSLENLKPSDVSNIATDDAFFVDVFVGVDAAAAAAAAEEEEVVDDATDEVFCCC